jgi:hypothetical protein
MTMVNPSQLFQSDLRRLSKPLSEGLCVRHIAHFGLAVCSGKGDQEKVLSLRKFAAYDHIPIRESGKIVAILERNNGNGESVRRALDEDVLISADEPLANFIHTVRKQPYRLVLDGARIEGIVTRSDLLKVPVLLLGYSLLSQLELLANRAIDIKYNGSDEWLSELERLEGEQAKKIATRKRKAASENLFLPAIELADLVDKLRVIRDFLPEGCEFEAELRELVRFRNAVDHVRPLIPSNAHLDQFVRRLEIVTTWTVAIEQKIGRHGG